MTDHSNRCEAKNKRGEPCRAAATETGYCYFHSKPDIASELGRRGGRMNRRAAMTGDRSLPMLAGASGIRAAIEQTIDDLYKGTLSPRAAAALASLFSTLVRTLGPAELEEELKVLKQKIKDLELLLPNQLRQPEDRVVSAH